MAKKKRRYRKKLTAASKCRDCGLKGKVPGKAYLQASTPRCLACGGMMERVRDINLHEENSKKIEND